MVFADTAIPILMYHEVAEPRDIDTLARKTQRGYILERSEFERQVAFLADAGFQTISLARLEQWRQSAGPLPAKPLVITFDDGFQGNHLHALPILARYGLSATFFVVSNKIGDPYMMTWRDLAEIRRAGMEVGSHTANHPLLSTLNEDRTRDELTLSKRMIEDRLGSEAAFLSLPNGDSNPYYVPLARAAGYCGGCCSRFGFNDRSTDPYYWRRIAVKAGVPLKTFADIVSRRPATLAYLMTKATGKSAVARLLGKRNYDRLYNLVFGVEEQEKGAR